WWVGAWRRSAWSAATALLGQGPAQGGGGKDRLRLTEGAGPPVELDRAPGRRTAKQALSPGGAATGRRHGVALGPTSTRPFMPRCRVQEYRELPGAAQGGWNV